MKFKLGLAAVAAAAIFFAGCKDDDQPQSPIVSLFDAAGSEGDTISVYVKLNKASTQTITATFFTQNITTTENDYRLDGPTVTFLPGAVLDSLRVHLIKDALTENPESFQIDVVSIDNGRFEGRRPVVTITDN